MSGGRVISGRYIVLFKKSSTLADVRAASSIARAGRAEVGPTYTKAIHGFAAKLSATELLRLRRNHLPDVPRWHRPS